MKYADVKKANLSYKKQCSLTKVQTMKLLKDLRRLYRKNAWRNSLLTVRQKSDIEIITRM